MKKSWAFVPTYKCPGVLLDLPKTFLGSIWIDVESFMNLGLVILKFFANIQ